MYRPATAGASVATPTRNSESHGAPEGGAARSAFKLGRSIPVTTTRARRVGAGGTSEMWMPSAAPEEPSRPQAHAPTAAIRATTSLRKRNRLQTHAGRRLRDDDRVRGIEQIELLDVRHRLDRLVRDARRAFLHRLGDRRLRPEILGRDFHDAAGRIRHE